MNNEQLLYLLIGVAAILAFELVCVMLTHKRRVPKLTEADIAKFHRMHGPEVAVKEPRMFADYSGFDEDLQLRNRSERPE